MTDQRPLDQYPLDQLRATVHGQIQRALAREPNDSKNRMSEELAQTVFRIGSELRPLSLSPVEMEAHSLQMLDRAILERGLPLTAIDLQRKLTEVREFDEFYSDPDFQNRGCRAFLHHWNNRIKDLWNYTPRDELGGLRPTEKMSRLVEARASLSEICACPVIIPTDFF